MQLESIHNADVVHVDWIHYSVLQLKSSQRLKSVRDNIKIRVNLNYFAIESENKAGRHLSGVAVI